MSFLKVINELYWIGAKDLKETLAGICTVEVFCTGTKNRRKYIDTIV
ncbi:MAG: hypothetical protein ACOWWR_08645 [Eubacteriales bacterium]